MKLLNPAIKKPLQFAQAFLVLVVFVLACVRNSSESKAFDLLILIMSVASMFSISYQLVTQLDSKHQHLGNPKIYFTISLIETLFWTAITIIDIGLNISKCVQDSENLRCETFFSLSVMTGILFPIVGYIMALYWTSWRAARAKLGDAS
ncbi:C6 zinc finger protein [Paramyrothecium foliicola]|nr:C6 zinc finger protein [Paramyrothecium foliicola]